MKTRSLQARDGVWIGLALAALFTATFVPETTFGAERVVLGEEFTNTG